MKRIRQMCWPELELNLKEWIMEKRREGFIISGSSILREAWAQAVRMKINNFKGSAFWVFSFMKRNKEINEETEELGEITEEIAEEDMVEDEEEVASDKDQNIRDQLIDIFLDDENFESEMRISK